jgi:hypothetical protein
LKGLEVSILSFSEVVAENRDKRIDSQYFRRAALAADALIARLDHEAISDIATDVRSFGAYALTNEFEYQEEGVPFLRGTNYHGNFINFADAYHISEDAHRLLNKSEVLPGMVLLSMSGSVGSVAVALDSWKYPINSNQDIAKIIPSKVSPYYLAAYLSSRFGQIQIERLPVGSVQQHVFLWMIERIQVPRFAGWLEDCVAELAASAYRLNETVSEHFDDAEAVLVSALGLADWTPPEPLSYTARASDAFAAGRLDAQYFMPAKEQVRQSLAALPGQLLSDRVDSIREQWLPDRAPPHMRVRNYDVTDALVPLLDAEKEPTAAADIGSMKKVLRDGDVVISRLRAYLKEIAVVRTDDDVLSVGSSEFIVLRPRGTSISPEALIVFLRSAPVQTILKWCRDGSQHPRFSEGDLLSIAVPDALEQVSPQIAAIVQKGFAARSRALQLLDCARHAVEIAIENGELAAASFLAQHKGAANG